MALSLIGMLRKRHAGDSWMVFEELGNATGSSVRRHADAVALGLWPSRGHELHGYEIKISRSDVQAELSDPSKADAVGRYMDFWWLVVGDLAIIDGLVIPERWGILYPKNDVLRVHRKAPKLEARPVDRGFAASMIRNGMSRWVPKHVHDTFKAEAMDRARAEIERERKYQRDTTEDDLERLKARVEAFEKASGVSISAGQPWEVGQIGDVVRTLLQAREAAGSSKHSHWRPDVERIIAREIAELEDGAARAAKAAAVLSSTAESVRRQLVAIPALPFVSPAAETAVEPQETIAWARSMAHLLDPD